jgi:hypothetical protein
VIAAAHARATREQLELDRRLQTHVPELREYADQVDAATRAVADAEHAD